MHAFLVTGNTQTARLQKARQILSDFGLKEVILIEPEGSKHLIASIRELKNILKISPLDREKGRGIIIEEANLLLQEAANAFLKTLEEPPIGNYLVLTAPTKESVLETIASRTAQIELGATDLYLSGKDLERAESVFDKLTNGRVGDKYNFADSVKDRATALTFVLGQIYTIRLRMLNNPSLEFVLLLESLERTRVYLEANVNVKLALSELVLDYVV